MCTCFVLQCFLSSLFVADSNNLQGTIPSELEVIQSLVEFDIDNNTLAGTITSAFGKLSLLKFLDLDTNLLEGEIPEALYNLTSLIALDLDGNRLSGTVSSRIGLLTNLFIVQLDNNYLRGNIPTETGLLTNLGTCVLHVLLFCCHTCVVSFLRSRSFFTFCLKVTLRPLVTSSRVRFQTICVDSQQKHLWLIVIYVSLKDAVRIARIKSVGISVVLYTCTLQ